jgi:hypothetical protein
MSEPQTNSTAIAGSSPVPCSLKLDLYAPEIDVEVSSMIAGQYKDVIKYTEIEKFAVLKAWLADDDLQAIKVCSTSIGFVRGYQKRFKPRHSPENSFVERTRLFNPCYTNWLLNAKDLARRALDSE